MPLNSKFLAESAGQNVVKIGQYLAKIWTKCNSLLFWPPCRYVMHQSISIWCFYSRQLGTYKRNTKLMPVA